MSGFFRQKQKEPPMQSLASTSILINAPKYRTSHRQDAGIGVGVKAARAALKSFPTERFSNDQVKYKSLDASAARVKCTVLHA